MEGIFGSDCTKEIDDESESDEDVDENKNTLWLKIQKILSTILMTLSSIFAGFIMDKSLGVFSCTKQTDGTWAIME
jgi:ABC-type methionine transport system permease subunit